MQRAGESPASDWRSSAAEGRAQPGSRGFESRRQSCKPRSTGPGSTLQVSAAQGQVQRRLRQAESPRDPRAVATARPRSGLQAGPGATRKERTVTEEKVKYIASARDTADMLERMQEALRPTREQLERDLADALERVAAQQVALGQRLARATELRGMVAELATPYDAGVRWCGASYRCQYCGAEATRGFSVDDHYPHAEDCVVERGRRGGA